MVNRSINLTEPAPIYFTVLASGQETCLGSCDGILSIDSISGGVMSYTGLITDNATGTINALLINEVQNITQNRL